MREEEDEKEDDDGTKSDNVKRMTSMTTRFCDEYWSLENRGSLALSPRTLGC